MKKTLLALSLSLLGATVAFDAPVISSAMAEQTAVEAQQQYSDLDLAKWAMPLASFFAQKEANVRDMGAEPNQVLYWSQPFDSKNQILTPNDTVLYISTQITTFKGPMVLEIPATEGDLAIFGSLVTPFMVPMEDVGGSKGIDKGLGGKILITPPGFDGEVPEGYMHVPSEHFNTTAGIRVTPVSFKPADLAAAEAYIKKIKLYRHGEKEATVYVDGAGKSYDPRPKYDENFFVLVNEYIQTENHKSLDLPFVNAMKRLGLEKGKPFEPTVWHETTAKALFEDRSHAFESVGNQFFPKSKWTTPVIPMEAKTQFGYIDDNGYHWEARSLTWHWAIWGPKHLGGDTFYLVGQKDSDGNNLMADRTYSLTVPANVPAKKFWSVTAYDATTGGTFFRGLPKVGISSKQQDLEYNKDGSVTLYFGPNKPEQAPAANYVPVEGNQKWFTLFRWYGPQPALMPQAGDKRWTMGDFERI